MPPGESPVLDRAQLSRRTQGSESLEIELLALFSAESERLLRQVEAAEDGPVRSDRLQALASLARNTGASRLAEVARGLEMRLVGGEADFSALRGSVAEVLEHIRGMDPRSGV